MKRFLIALLLLAFVFGTVLPSMPIRSSEASAAIAAKADRQERRAERRIAREIFRTAADDLGLSRLELAKRLKAGDPEAWAAIATVKATEFPNADIDWERILRLVIAIAELLLKFFADATAYQPMFCVAPPAMEPPGLLKLPTAYCPLAAA